MPNLEKATDKQINTLQMFMDNHKVEFKKILVFQIMCLTIVKNMFIYNI